MSSSPTFVIFWERYLEIPFKMYGIFKLEHHKISLGYSTEKLKEMNI